MQHLRELREGLGPRLPEPADDPELAVLARGAHTARSRSQGAAHRLLQTRRARARDRGRGRRRPGGPLGVGGECLCARHRLHGAVASLARRRRLPVVPLSLRRRRGPCAQPPTGSLLQQPPLQAHHVNIP